ncbi:MAG: fumarate hydratase [Candidatus Cloacimonetes bacterium]|nr:fumarate hydratase [Candidatus Cloacimonadota bacterium]
MRKRRIVPVSLLREKLLEAVGKIYCQPDAEVIRLIAEAAHRESNPLARDMLQSIVDNARYAIEDGTPCCQDTGSAVLFIEMGEDASFDEGNVTELICATLEEAWERYYLRRSIVEEPLISRRVLQNRVVPIIHWKLVPGDSVEVIVGLKGGGAENMSVQKMMPATATIDKVKEYIVEEVAKTGGRPCPPVIVGVGIGGNFEESALLAKRALFDPLGRKHPDKDYAALENDILTLINTRGRGVMGMGEGPTALAVHIRTKSCHIASLPLAINLDCHAHRHTRFVL